MIQVPKHAVNKTYLALKTIMICFLYFNGKLCVVLINTGGFVKFAQRFCDLHAF